MKRRFPAGRSRIKRRYDRQFSIQLHLVKYESTHDLAKTIDRLKPLWPASIMKVTQTLRILHVEDNLIDRELVAEVLRREGICYECVYAATEKELNQALLKCEFDVILSDFTLPGFDGRAALASAKAAQPETPFIFVSGTIGEERAVEALKLGATDYVLKNHLERLGAVVERALREAKQIVERKKAEEALRASEERFRQLAENIQEVFWLTDLSKTKMLYISPAYERIWGRTCQSLYDDPLSWLAAIHPDDRDRISDAATTRQTSGAYDEQFRIVRPDGQIRWILDRAFPICDASGKVYRVVGVAEDITDRLLLEEQFLHAQKMEVFGQLAGGVAHDFNNILTVIQMQSSLTLSNESLDAETRASINDIARAAERATNLTRQLLTFSRRQASQPRDLDLRELVGNMTKFLQRILGDHIALSSCFAPNLPLAHADPGMIEQVIMNLAVNARDAMPKGGRLGISIECANIEIANQLEHPEAKIGRFARISVSDNGSGIAPEALPRIFEPFFTTKEVGKGTGLGLATVHGIVKQHNGWIKVDTQPGVGTTFHIFLPVLEQSTISISPVATQPVPGGHETILLVEDESVIRSLVRTVLERFGYTVVEAENGLEGLACWRRHPGRIDLLVTDMVMPGGLSGRDLAEELKRLQPDLKVLYISGYSPELADHHFGSAAGHSFVHKPFSTQALAEAVRHCLDKNLP
ncbi:MAG: sensor hybrid histidine kinase [Verrucomicrobiales bacterium]|nr:sensor hybrid histidine kinase [Verrucomicrobiales bacterium]